MKIRKQEYGTCNIVGRNIELLRKRRGIKQRLFRCTPLHHHYTIADEKLDKECSYMFKGPKRPMHEAKVTVRFWIVTIIMAAITLMTLKVR